MTEPDQIAQDLHEAHSRLLALLDSEENKIEDLLHDHPIFTRLNRNDLLIATGVIAMTLSDQSEALSLLPLELPDDLITAINSMSIHQMQIVLCWMTIQLEKMPITCDLCDSAPADPVSGFCDQCDARLNSGAALQVCGGWGEDRDSEYINGIGY